MPLILVGSICFDSFNFFRDIFYECPEGEEIPKRKLTMVGFNVLRKTCKRGIAILNKRMKTKRAEGKAAELTIDDTLYLEVDMFFEVLKKELDIN